MNYADPDPRRCEDCGDEMSPIGTSPAPNGKWVYYCFHCQSFGGGMKEEAKKIEAITGDEIKHRCPDCAGPVYAVKTLGGRWAVYCPSCNTTHATGATSKTRALAPFKPKLRLS